MSNFVVLTLVCARDLVAYQALPHITTCCQVYCLIQCQVHYLRVLDVFLQFIYGQWLPLFLLELRWCLLRVPDV